MLVIYKKEERYHEKNLTLFYLLTFLMITFSSVCVRADTCTEHQWGDWIEEWSATCVKDGSRSHECQICNTIEHEAIPATGEHTWGDWQESSKPSCVKDGLEHRLCSNCTAQETRPIPATGQHDWGKWRVVYGASCADTGLSKRTCAVCYKTEKKEIPKTKKHSWEGWEVTKRATALSKGTKVRYCYECDKKETLSIPKLKAKISLMKKSVTIKSGSSYSIKIRSKTYGDKIKRWKSSNNKVATVNSKGKVIGKQKGVATITLVMRSKVSATCRVRVTKPRQIANPQPVVTLNPQPVVTPNPQPAQPSYVWLSATGDKYHNIPNCGRMNPATARQVTLGEAVGQGYGPCSKCF